jgi:hypothetical protein
MSKMDNRADRKRHVAFASMLNRGILFAFLLTLIVALAGCSSNNNDAVSGNATLSWNAPTANADGTPLTDLAGYRIYFGTSSGAYSAVIDAGNSTTYVINNLARGTHYFAVTAYNTSGNESSYSDEGSKTIP